MTDKLAQDYFEKFRVRVKTLRIFFDEKDYSDVMREGQEALELFIKALIRSLHIQPEFGHDPGKQLTLYADQLSEPWKKLSPTLADWSKRLRRSRELAFYGAEDFIPSEEFSKKDALEVIDFLEMLSKELSKNIEHK